MNAIVNPSLPSALPALSAAALARVEAARRIAREVACPAAEAVGREARFPQEAMAALKAERLVRIHGVAASSPRRELR